ncbi:nuclear receptor subfamily 2 group E member 1-like isoform X1 [Acropora muricata]|uniref:nuclear receptor subfamily 2 group E member 1-like isoform X1 n=2 Tax=Acropora muricata TaxID=159855 RepID=UPI0034E58E3C
MSFRGPSYKTIARQYGSRLKIRDQELMQWFHLTWGACEVCGDRSTGKHYGVFSCDGCSGFYKRTCRRSEPWLCKAQGNCPVDKSSRNDCKACRLKKCIEIGMNLEGVYRRFKYNEDLIQSSSRENAVDNSTSDVRLDVTPPPKPQGFSVVSPQMRIIEAKSVMIKTEEQQDHHQQQSQHEHPFTTMEIENRLKSLGSPRYFEETPGEEYLAEPSDSLAGDKDHNSSARPLHQTTSPTTMSTSMVTSSMRASFASPNNNMNFRHGVTATASPSHRFQQNGHKSPPPSMNKSVTQEPELSGSRMGCTAVMSFRNSKRQLSAFQMTMAELHQAVEPLSFHTSEPLHDMASRLLTSSLRFGRRLPCFRRLPFRDQVILLEEAWREMLLLDSVFWGSSLSPGASSEAESSREQELKTVHETLGPLKTLKLESPEYACLKAIILFRTNTHGLKAADQVEQLQDEAQLLLADYVWSRLPVQPARFGKILLSVAALRSLAEKPIDQLFFSAVPGKDMFESILSQVISSN